VASGDTCYRVAGHFKTTRDFVFKGSNTDTPCDDALLIGDLLTVCPNPGYPPSDCSVSD
jgi:hypothetical protein